MKIPRKTQKFDGRTSLGRQCPMLSYHDGTNACALEEGHDGQHENHFGSSCETHGWGSPDAVIAYLTAQYQLPRRRDNKGNPR